MRMRSPPASCRRPAIPRRGCLSGRASAPISASGTSRPWSKSTSTRGRGSQRSRRGTLSFTYSQQPRALAARPASESDSISALKRFLRSRGANSSQDRIECATRLDRRQNQQVGQHVQVERATARYHAVEVPPGRVLHLVEYVPQVAETSDCPRDVDGRCGTYHYLGFDRRRLSLQAGPARSPGAPAGQRTSAC